MLPTFLIIGAQKSGTTTLYRDLLTQPGVFFPLEKEPSALAFGNVLTPPGLAEYEAMYAGAKATDARGDGSTSYARIPKFRGVPSRSMEVLGPDIQLIYIIREPISRIVSHHHHVVTNEPAPPTVDEFVDAGWHTIDFSRYAFQARAWLEVYPRERLHVIVFEEYVKHRREEISRLAPILGFEPRPDRIDVDARFNTADDRSADRGLAMRFRKTWAYQQVRPMLGVSMRDRLRRMFAAKAPPPPPPPSAACVERLLKELEDDQRELADLIGRPYPIWDPEKVRRKYARA